MTNEQRPSKDLDFGDYCHIEQRRFGAPNEMYLHKVIGRLRSNSWVDVPVPAVPEEIVHPEMEDVVACICCGVSERLVLRFRATDCLPVARPAHEPPPEQLDEHDAGIIRDLEAMAANQLAGFWPQALAVGALRLIKECRTSPPPVTHIALLEAHGRNSLLHAADFRAVIVPPGQSLGFDEGPSASRRWLHPYLGNTHHLVSFIEIATSTKGENHGE